MKTTNYKTGLDKIKFEGDTKKFKIASELSGKSEIYRAYLWKNRARPYGWFVKQLETHFTELGKIPLIRQVANHCVDMAKLVYKDDSTKLFKLRLAIMDAAENCSEEIRSASDVFDPDNAWNG